MAWKNGAMLLPLSNLRAPITTELAPLGLGLGLRLAPGAFFLPLAAAGLGCAAYARQLMAGSARLAWSASDVHSGDSSSSSCEAAPGTQSRGCAGTHSFGRSSSTPGGLLLTPPLGDTSGTEKCVTGGAAAQALGDAGWRLRATAVRGQAAAAFAAAAAICVLAAAIVEGLAARASEGDTLPAGLGLLGRAAADAAAAAVVAATSAAAVVAVSVGGATMNTLLRVRGDGGGTMMHDAPASL
jgi:hypothetical protein